jgi:hypothetical protein
MRQASTDQPCYSILRRRTTLPQLGGLRLPSYITTVSYPMSYTDGIQTARPPRGLGATPWSLTIRGMYNRNYQNGHQPILVEAVAPSADRSLLDPLGCPSQADKETVPLRVPVSQWKSQRSLSPNGSLSDPEPSGLGAPRGAQNERTVQPQLPTWAQAHFG